MTNDNRASNHVVIAAVALAGLMFAGCSGGPKDDAQNYINNLKLFNYRATYDQLSHGDQLDRTIDQFLNNIPLAPDVDKEWFKSVLTHTDYALGEAKIDGNNATVPLQVTAPDLALWERTIDTLPTTKASSEAQAQDSLGAGTFPKVTYTDSMVMVKEPEGWKLVVNFPQKENVAKMHKNALELYHKHDYDKAITAYTELLAELDKSPATGNEGLKFLYGRELKDIQNVKAQMAEAQSYIPKLVLSDVDLKMSSSRVPGIFGKVTNSGDKALDEVQMTVNYYEGKGKKKKQTATEDHAALATPFTFTNFARPVLPLVPGETRDFGFKLTAPVDVQQRATPDLVVSGVVFTQSPAPLPKPPTPAASVSATPASAASPTAK